MTEQSEKVLYALFVIFILTISVILMAGADWQHICTSWLRFTKPYVAMCVVKGYPLFP